MSAETSPAIAATVLGPPAVGVELVELLPQALTTSAATIARTLFMVVPPAAYELEISTAYYREP
jgi:hypothetical protein